MKEPIEQHREWLNSEIERYNKLEQSEPNLDKKIGYLNRAISLSDAVINLQTIEEAHHNAFIDKLIEEGRKSETLCEEIKHNAKEKPYGL